MPTTLDPIDDDGTTYRVKLNGKRIGLVTRNVTLGSVIWQHKVADDAPPAGVFSEPQEAADALALKHMDRKPKRKTK